MKQLIIKSCCKYTLKTYTTFLELLFNKMGQKSSTFYLPANHRKITILKSPHVNKKAKEQFQIITYKAVISLDEKESNLSLHQFSTFLLNKPKTISIKIKS